MGKGKEVNLPFARGRGVSYERHRAVPLRCGACGKQFDSLYSYTGHFRDELRKTVPVGDDLVQTWASACLSPHELRKGGWKKDGNGVWRAPLATGDAGAAGPPVQHGLPAAGGDQRDGDDPRETERKG